ncbi:MAG: cytochrome b [Pseudobdellovibrionaceae bacterium]|jgi:cytochrome b561|nr:cytochrome b [Pseudobdellovibrionaceae bacterium]
MTDHYTCVAILLHWLIGLSIIALLVLGLTMEDFPKSMMFTAFMIHKSLGLTVLVLTVARIFWRLTHRAPAMPDTMKSWEKFAAHAVHFGLYFLMLALPLSGWAMVSSSARGYPTVFFGLFEWPHIPFLSNMTDLESKKEISHSVKEAHETLAWIAIVLIAMHIGAALKHHIINRDSVLTRMLPFLKPLPAKGTSPS